MKFYDKEMYAKENFIKAILTILLSFLIGFTAGCVALYDQVREKEQIIVNQSIELESLRETVWMQTKGADIDE